MLFSIYMVIMMQIHEKHFWNSGKLSDHFSFLEQNQFYQTQFVLNLSHNHSQKPKIYLMDDSIPNLVSVSKNLDLNKCSTRMNFDQKKSSVENCEKFRSL